MQKILIIVHAPPYGSERCLSALRLAITLAGHEEVRPELAEWTLAADKVITF